jgi:hypothetical protein
MRISLGQRASREVGDERNQKQDQKDEEQDLRDSGRRTRDPAKSQSGSDESDDQKN